MILELVVFHLLALEDRAFDGVLSQLFTRDRNIGCAF